MVALVVGVTAQLPAAGAAGVNGNMLAPAVTTALVTELAGVMHGSVSDSTTLNCGVTPVFT